MIQPLEPPDNHHLHAAQGWVGLGDYVQANEELEMISPAQRAHPDVLEIRFHIYFHAKKWDACVDIAGAILKLDANRPELWIKRSFALHELKRTQEAFDKLLPVGNKFRKLWRIPYNLACYCAQLGRLDDCKEWFKRAMAIDKETIQPLAIDDPDLKPLWDSMGGTLWKRRE